MSTPPGRPVGPQPRSLAVLAGLAYLGYLIVFESAATGTGGLGLAGDFGRDGAQIWAAGFAAGVAGLWAALGTRV